METIEESPGRITRKISLGDQSYIPPSGVYGGPCGSVCKCVRITYPGASKKAFLSRVLRL